jgi:hypothetical protein
MKKTRFTWSQIIVVIAGLNFLWFIVEASLTGGSALSGYVRDGHCFVREYGQYTEVPCLYWEWNRIHSISVIGMGLLTVVGLASDWLYRKVYGRS